jgi:hypothetical protein
MNKHASELGKLAKGKPKAMTEAALTARRINSRKGVDRLREIRAARKEGTQ